MTEVWIFAAGFVVGITVSTISGRVVLRRTARRLAYHFDLEATASDLERHREARDSGRATAVRPGTGLAGDQSNLFALRPGKLELNRLQEKRERLAKGVVDQAISGKLNESGSKPANTQDQ